MSNLVLVTISAWVTFSQSRNKLAKTVQQLILDQRVARCGIIELELRKGFKQDETKLLTLVMACPELDTTPADYTQAGGVLGELRRAGRTITPSDGLIAAVAVRHEVDLLADDKHFKHYPDINLF